MPGLFSDVRKTMIGAFVLLVIAILFTDHGGFGDEAVSGAKAAVQEHRHNAVRVSGAAAPIVQQTPASWFAPEDDDQPAVAAPAGPAGPPPQAPAEPGAIRPPDPVGPDFPPGLRYSSSASSP